MALTSKRHLPIAWSCIVLITLAHLIAVVLYTSGSVIGKESISYVHVTIYDEPTNQSNQNWLQYRSGDLDRLDELTNQSNQNWLRYRLGDMVQHKHWAIEGIGYRLHKREFPQSIATQYLSHIFGSNGNGTFNDYRLLLQIVKNRTLNSSATALINSIDYNHSLIIHLRTGDIIDTSHLNVGHILGLGGLRYHRSRSYYVRVINESKTHGLRKALFLTGWHVPCTDRCKHRRKSIRYIKEIMRLFESNGYETFLRINENTDDDFLIMCNSKYFVQSGGGFSQVISKVVKLNGGKVYDADE
eukprot:183448_1